jgi:hypothetical protein
MILLGNIICFIGVCFLTYAHYNIGVKDNSNKGFFVSSIGASILIVGCFVLSSYPFVVLNILWLMISIIGYKKINIKSILLGSKKIKNIQANIILFGLLIHGLIQLYLNNNNEAAWMTTFIYLTSYLLFSTRIISRETYLTWCIPAFLISIPHLLEVSNFAVIINEFIGAVISVYSVSFFVYNKFKK